MRHFFNRDLETADADSIHAMQDRLVREAVARAQQNRFFRRHYAAVSADADRIQTGADLRRLPIVRKADILADIAENPPFGNRLAVPTNQIRNIVESSGTSGSAAEVQALTEGDLDAVIDAEAVGFIWAGTTPGSIVAFNIPVTMTAAGCWWHLTLHRMGCNALRLGGIDTTRRLAYLQRYAASHMLAAGHYLRRLTHVAQAEGYDPGRDFPALKAIFVGGGGWSTATAEGWSQDWQATLYEQYGSSQRCFAWTCELGAVHHGQRGVIHGLPHTCLMELINPDTGEWADDGEEGEIVITLLNQEASPLVRYGTGDLAIRRVGRSCACGRPFDGIEAGSVRRMDDMLRVRGMNLWPAVVDETVLAHGAVVDYRGTVWLDDQASERVSLTVETWEGAADSQPADLAETLEREVKAATSLSCDVTVEPTAQRTTPTSMLVTGKGKRWTDLR